MNLISHIEYNTELLVIDNIITESEVEFFELLSSKEISKYMKTTRSGLGARRFTRGLATLLVSAIPIVGQIYAMWTILAEAGIVRISEKHAFIRFQGLTDMHADRISKKLKTRFYETELHKIHSDFTNLDGSDYKIAYYEMLAREAALIVTGYIRIEITDKLSDDDISEISNSIMSYRFSTGQNTGVWNRFKSALGALGLNLIGLGVVSAIFPLQSFLGQFNELSKSNSTNEIKKLAIRYLNEYLKKTN